MASDLALLVPSRGRPKNVARLTDACAETCRTDYEIHWGFDDDDPELTANWAAAGINVTTMPRMGLAKWTNVLAHANLHVPFLCSIGDDMVPLTVGWDEMLIEAAGPDGMAYPNDRRRDDIPECIVIGTPIVRELGWMCEPTLGHWFVDSVWRDLGSANECLAYLREVVVEHKHPNVGGGDPSDATYHEAAAGFAADMASYQKWRLHRMRSDVETVKRARAAG